MWPASSTSFGALALALMIVFAFIGQTAPAAAEGFPWPEEILTQHWPGTYWWCPGSAWDEANIEFNLKTMNEAGIRNVHIVPIYGANGYEERYLEYLSPEWMAMLGHIVKTAESLGMNVDMTTGTGWCFGGPTIEGAFADTVISPNEDGEGYTMKPGRMVKRAAPGGEGMMLNPYSPEAMKHYLTQFSEAFDKAQPALPRAQYHDSFEYMGNWSEDLPEVFKARRGYDLEARIPELLDSGTDPDILSRLKYDYRLTLAERHLEAIRVWVDWCHARGMVTRDQAHGSPTNLLDTYAAADIPETEMFGAPEFPIPGFRLDPDMSREGDVDTRVCRMAASAAHIAHEPGKQIVSSETCTWLREHWHTSLADVKLQLDRFFLAGINHIFYHGTCYSPQDAPWPGWFFYASTKFDWRNSIWRDLPYLNAYVARSQSVLQAGTPANDILLYWPIHDLWSSPEGMDLRMSVHTPTWMEESRMGEVADQLTELGYTFDFVSDALLQGITFRDGLLRATGSDYRAIVVPKCLYMPPETLRLLNALADQGAPVFFEGGLPEDVPGFADLESRRAAFAEQRRRVTKPVVLDVSAALDAAGIARETLVDSGLQFIRRRVDDGYYYFIVNHTAKSFDDWLPIAVPFMSARQYDPMTGMTNVSELMHTRFEENSRAVYLQLEPGASAIVRTSSRPAEGIVLHPLQLADGAIPIDGPWRLEFIDGGPTLPAATTLDTLASWTETPGGEAKAFAGAGRYSTHFNLPPDTEAHDWLLDLGDVRESARVRVNGRDAGAFFALPFRMRIGQLLQPGENTLEIEVTNLTANRIRDLSQQSHDWMIMRDINIVTVDYTEFKPEEWPLVESGLLGPVRLIPMLPRNLELHDKVRVSISE